MRKRDKIKALIKSANTIRERGLLNSLKDINPSTLFDYNFDEALEDAFRAEGPIEGDTPIEQAAFLLEHTHRVLVFLGSGFSADSGIATFRAKDALSYKREDYVEMTRAQTFEESPAKQLAWHQRWRDEMIDAIPHEGQHALLRIARGKQYLFITQNVDHLLERAAKEDDFELDVIHLHGELTRVKCHDCGHEFEDPEFDFIDPRACEVCGGRLRPAVVWFGEAPNAWHMERAKKFARQAEVCVLIGASAVVYPAAAIPELAKASGARLIELNTNPTPATQYCDVVIQQGAREALVAIEAQIKASSRDK